MIVNIRLESSVDCKINHLYLQILWPGNKGTFVIEGVAWTTIPEDGQQFILCQDIRKELEPDLILPLISVRATCISCRGLCARRCCN